MHLHTKIRSFSTSLIRWLGQFVSVPPSDDIPYRKDLIMVGVSFALGILTIPPTFLRFALEGMSSPSGFVLLGASLCFWLVPVALRLTGKRTVMSTLLVTLCLATIWSLMLFEGGLDSEVLPWIPFLVIACGMWAERDVVVYAAFLSILSLMALYVGHSLALLPPNHSSPGQHYLLALTSTSLAVVFGGLLAWLYDSSRRRAESQRDESDHAMNSILSALPDPILQLLPDGQVTSIRIPQQSTSWKALEALAPAHIGELLYSSSVEGVIELITEVLAHDEPATTKLMISLASSQILCEVRIIPESEARVVVILRDTTQMEHLSRVNDELIGAIRDELRDPVDSILRMSRALVSGHIEALPEKAEKMVKSVDFHAGSLRRLLEDLLEFERLESGYLSMRRAPFSLRGFADDVIKQNKHIARAFSIQLVCEPPVDGSDTLDVEVLTDRMRLLHALSRMVLLLAEQLPPKSTLNIVAMDGLIDEDGSEFARIGLECRGAVLAPEFTALMSQYFDPAWQPETRQDSRISAWLLKVVAETLDLRISFSDDYGFEMAIPRYRSKGE